ncbi:hypothetical protein LZ30DRAFT_112471 [Colletotrichum cereale]|nr:hypothetical protein LZ30DRAFT_112471 [Colletotrichum cereale]
MSATTICMSHNGNGGRRRTAAMSPSLWGRLLTQHPPGRRLEETEGFREARTASNSTRWGVSSLPGSCYFGTHPLAAPPGRTDKTRLCGLRSRTVVWLHDGQGGPAGFLHRRNMHTQHCTARPQAHTNASITAIVYGCPSTLMISLDYLPPPP